MTIEIVIKDVKVMERDITDKKKWSRSGVFFFIENEKLSENLENRKTRSYTEYKKLLPEVLKRAGLQSQEANWSQKAGCTCPCSPGFLLNESTGHDIFVTII